MNGRILTIVLAAMLAGCATPDRRKLSQFTTLSLPGSVDLEVDGCRIETARIGKACLKELFRTNKIHKQFAVYWLSVTATDGSTVNFDRGKVALTVMGSKNYPVGPGRVAYLSRSQSTAMLIAAIVAPVAVGGPIMAVANTAYYVNLTAVAASGHVAATSAGNEKRAGGTRLGSLPGTASIQSGSELAGFLFFEVAGDSADAAVLEGELRIAGMPRRFDIDTIPVVNPRF